jgi:hypothetical protein
MRSNRRSPDRSSGRWYVPVVTGLVAVVAIWAIAENSRLNAKPDLEIAAER